MPRKRKRRTPGSGYTTEAKNGTWIAYFPKFGAGYHVRRGFATRSDAEAWLDSLLTQKANKIDIGSGQMSVRTWNQKWTERAAVERQWKAKMVEDVKWKLAYVNPHLGDLALADVLPDHVDAMWDILRQSLAENTMRQIRNYLWQVFEEARERRYITFNPVLKPKRRKRAKQKPPQRLSTPQAALIVHSASTSFYALAWWLILTLGLRAGEVCGLRWGDVDLEAATLTVAQEVTDLRGVAHKDTPKGDKVRTLPFARALIPLFRLQRQWYTRRAAQGLHKGYWHEHGLVFPGRAGKPMNPNSLRHQLHTLTNALHLPPVTIHMLRHTAGAFYTDLNTPQHITSAILGHAPNITGHYAPPGVETLREWTEQVYRQLSGEVERVRKERAIS